MSPVSGRDGGGGGVQLEKLRRLVHDRGQLAPIARLVAAQGRKPGARVTVLLQRGPQSLYVAFTVARG